MAARHRALRLAALLAAAAIAAALPALGAGYDIARAPYRFVFPRDHAAHPGYQSEWWYFTGHLRDGAGRRFGYELTFFRAAFTPRARRPARGQSAWRGSNVYPAHFAITDQGGGRFVYYERFTRDALGAGAASARTLDVRSGSWSLRGLDPMHLSAARGGDAIALELRSAKPPAIHGAGGVSRKAGCPSCASHYYSYTRMVTRGTMRYGGRTFAVTGISWMDHEFGSGELQADQAGWDWFALQLGDGREIMLYRLRRKDGSVTPESSGSLIERDGRVVYLARGDFATEALGAWTSPHTGARYPSGWRVRVPRAGVDLLLRPVLSDQELADTSGGISYWEGAVEVSAGDGGTVRGQGYVELTGYAGPISL